MIVDSDEVRGPWIRLRMGKLLDSQVSFHTLMSDPLPIFHLTACVERE